MPVRFAHCIYRCASLQCRKPITDKHTAMSLYEKYLLPSVIDRACSMPEVMQLRAEVVPQLSLIHI